jgi:hypothetical protein
MPKRHKLSVLKEELKKVFEVCKQGHVHLSSLRPINIRAEQSRYLLTINRWEWAKLQSLGVLKMRLANKHWKELVKVRKSQADAARRLKSLRDNAELYDTSLGELDHWKEIRLELLAKAQAAHLSSAETDQTIKHMRGLSIKALVAPAESRLKADIARLDVLMQRTLSVYAAGNLATQVAQFNVLAKQKNAGSTAASMITAVEKSTAIAVKALRDSLVQLAAGNAKEAAREATAASELVKNAVPEALQLAASLSISRSKNLLSNKLRNAQAVRIGNVLKLLGFIEVGAKVGEWLAVSSGTESSLAAKLLPPAGTTSRKWFASNGFDVVELAGETARGVRVLEGTVTHVKITHVARKPVSQVSLQSPVGKKSTAYLSHIKVNSAGIVPGAAVRLRVKSQAKVSWLKGQKADLIQRVDHSAAAKTSWSMALAYLLVPAFDVSPHSLAAEWSWDSGARGPGNPLKFGVLNRPNSPNDERIAYVNQMRRGIQQMARRR